MTEQERIRKLAEWAGFTFKFGGEWNYERYKTANAWWESPEGQRFKDLPNFPHSLDACFKWLTPELAYVDISSSGKEQYTARIRAKTSKGYFMATAPTPALTLCLAIEKLIDNQPSQRLLEVKEEM